MWVLSANNLSMSLHSHSGLHSSIHYCECEHAPLKCPIKGCIICHMFVYWSASNDAQSTTCDNEHVSHQQTYQLRSVPTSIITQLLHCHLEEEQGGQERRRIQLTRVNESVHKSNAYRSTVGVQLLQILPVRAGFPCLLSQRPFSIEMKSPFLHRCLRSAIRIASRTSRNSVSMAENLVRN